MSRCFPFPPPGYEKKIKRDEADILKKEKQKEKKHKKEKKEKDKKESKEKKEKYRSEGKHKDKKEKKEKRKEKKEKDRDKDKDKNKHDNYDEKRTPSNLGAYHGGESSKEKKLPVQNDDQSGEKVIQKEKEKVTDRTIIPGEKKFIGQFSVSNGEKHAKNSFQAENIKDPKFLQDFNKRIGNENREVRKLSSKGTKSGEGMGNLDKGVDKKLDVQSIKAETRHSGNSIVHDPAGVHTRVERIPQLMAKDVAQLLGKATDKEKKDNDNMWNKGEQKDRDKDREKKKEKTKMKNGHKILEKDPIKSFNKGDLPGAHNKLTSLRPVEGDKDNIEQNVRKRKDSETNGFAHDTDVKPNKLSRPTSSSLPLKENNKWSEVNSSSKSFLIGNGKVMESHQNSISSAPDKQGAAANNTKIDKKESKINGVIGAEVGHALKPPHPDIKYLTHLLSVPKMTEWCDLDDQEWLFQSKKPKVGCSIEDEAPQVWAEAVPIESADVCALPYVIPY